MQLQLAQNRACVSEAWPAFHALQDIAPKYAGMIMAVSNTAGAGRWTTRRPPASTADKAWRVAGVAASHVPAFTCPLSRPSAGTLSGLISVAVTGVVLQHFGGSGIAEGWRWAFALAAANCGVGLLVFIKFARGDRILD